MNGKEGLVDTRQHERGVPSRQLAWRCYGQDETSQAKTRVEERDRQEKQSLRLHIDESVGISSNSPTCSSKSSLLAPAPFDPSTPQIDALPRTASDKPTTVARNL